MPIRPVSFVAAAALVLTAGCGFARVTTRLQAPEPPVPSSSEYILSAHPTALQSQGCTAGKQAVSTHLSSGLYILDFGAPDDTILGGFQYGTLNFDLNFDALPTVKTAVEEWVKGFRRCSASYWKIWLHPHAYVGVGTSNYEGQTNYADGQAWASMVNGLNLWFRRHGISSEFTAVGASDMEEGWNSPANTIAWVKGYNSVGKASLGSYLYDYGDDANGLNPGNGWTAEDVWYVANGASLDYPIPEIYYTADATQDWAPLSLWAYENEGRAIVFKGVMTEHGANPSTLTPEQGWLALYQALAANPHTAQSNIEFLTDVTEPS